MSDTPQTDEQINGKPCTRFEVYVGDSLRDAWVASEFARKLERERDRYKSDVEVITKERDEAREQLRLANIDCFGAQAESNEAREALREIAAADWRTSGELRGMARRALETAK